MTTNNTTTGGGGVSGREVVCTPGVCGGRPRFDGTRIPLSTVEGCWKEGLDDAEILVDFPNLTQSDLDNARAYLNRTQG